ncbi:MAG: DUF4115 domain-containing protein [Chloroflexi bacterium]|nr:DUF4115 domain-containing protein [Chloroflexota bacterium]
MQTVGVWLRQAREARGSTLKEAEEAIRIRVRFLEALEAWDLAAFPGGDVQIRGFLRIYARYLGLPADEVLARYSGARPVGSAPSGAMTSRSAPGLATSRPRPAPVVTSRPRWMNAETLIIACILLILLPTIGVGGWYFIVRRGGAEETVAPAAATAPVEGGSSSTPVAPQTSPLVTPTFPVNPDGGVTLALEASEHVWVRVTADDTLIFEGMLIPGQAETWTGQELIIVDTGNGAGLLVTVNEQPQGRMCGRGEACSRGWGAGGEVVVPPLVPTMVP